MILFIHCKQQNRRRLAEIRKFPDGSALFLSDVKTKKEKSRWEISVTRPYEKYSNLIYV